MLVRPLLAPHTEFKGGSGLVSAEDKESLGKSNLKQDQDKELKTPPIAAPKASRIEPLSRPRIAPLTAEAFLDSIEPTTSKRSFERMHKPTVVAAKLTGARQENISLVSVTTVSKTALIKPNVALLSIGVSGGITVHQRSFSQLYKPTIRPAHLLHKRFASRCIIHLEPSSFPKAPIVVYERRPLEEKSVKRYSTQPLHKPRVFPARLPQETYHYSQKVIKMSTVVRPSIDIFEIGDLAPAVETLKLTTTQTKRTFGVLHKPMFLHPFKVGKSSRIVVGSEGLKHRPKVTPEVRTVRSEGLHQQSAMEETWSSLPQATLVKVQAACEVLGSSMRRMQRTGLSKAYSLLQDVPLISSRGTSDEGFETTEGLNRAHKQAKLRRAFERSEATEAFTVTREVLLKPIIDLSKLTKHWVVQPDPKQRPLEDLLDIDSSSKIAVLSNPEQYSIDAKTLHNYQGLLDAPQLTLLLATTTFKHAHQRKPNGLLEETGSSESSLITTTSEQRTALEPQARLTIGLYEVYSFDLSQTTSLVKTVQRTVKDLRVQYQHFEQLMRPQETLCTHEDTCSDKVTQNKGNISGAGLEESIESPQVSTNTHEPTGREMVVLVRPPVGIERLVRGEILKSIPISSADKVSQFTYKAKSKLSSPSELVKNSCLLNTPAPYPAQQGGLKEPKIPAAIKTTAQLKAIKRSPEQTRALQRAFKLIAQARSRSTGVHETPLSEVTKEQLIRTLKALRLSVTEQRLRLLTNTAQQQTSESSPTKGVGGQGCLLEDISSVSYKVKQEEDSVLMLGLNSPMYSDLSLQGIGSTTDMTDLITLRPTESPSFCNDSVLISPIPITLDRESKLEVRDFCDGTTSQDKGQDQLSLSEEFSTKSAAQEEDSYSKTGAQGEKPTSRTTTQAGSRVRPSALVAGAALAGMFVGCPQLVFLLLNTLQFASLIPLMHFSLNKELASLLTSYNPFSSLPNFAPQVLERSWLPEPYTKAEQYGFESAGFFFNIGQALLVLVSLFLVLLGLFLGSKLACCFSFKHYCSKKLTAFKASLLPGYYQWSFQEFLVAAIIQLRSQDYLSWVSALSCACAWTFLSCGFLSSLWLLCVAFSSPTRSSGHDEHGSSTLEKLQVPAFYVHRLVCVLTITLTTEPLVQGFVCLFASLLVISRQKFILALAVKLKLKSSWTFCIVEASDWLSMTVLLLYAFLPSLEDSLEMVNVFYGLTLITVAVSASTTLYHLIRYCKRSRRMRRHANESHKSRAMRKHAKLA
jgi:hypothetical protein